MSVPFIICTALALYTGQETFVHGDVWRVCTCEERQKTWQSQPKVYLYVLYIVSCVMHLLMGLGTDLIIVRFSIRENKYILLIYITNIRTHV
jgi:hypothetical protein